MQSRFSFSEAAITSEYSQYSLVSNFDQVNTQKPVSIMIRTHRNLVFVILLNLIISIYCNDVTICGGFVKSHANIELSQVEVEL